MPTQHDWSDYWRTEGAGGEVFVDGDGNKQSEVAAYWRERFSDLPANSRVLDVAAGAGSIYASIDADAPLSLVATDLSSAALELIAKRMPGVRTECCDAGALPFADASFDLVVSQYGIEYAGDAAFIEALRVLAPGGRLECLCHIRDGHIDARSAAHLTGVETAINVRFAERAADWVRAAFAGDAARLDEATRAFVPAERALHAAVQAKGEGIHVHLYHGFRQLHARLAHHDQAEVLAWLAANAAQLLETRERLAAMRAAARSAEDMAALKERLLNAGCVRVDLRPLAGAAHQRPIAWALSAQR